MADIDKARIYDRILEVCQPIAFQGKNYRKDIAQRKRLKAVQLLNEGTITN
jgi:DNA replication protein DnaC